MADTRASLDRQGRSRSSSITSLLGSKTKNALDGLCDDEITKRREMYGYNEVETKIKSVWWSIVERYAALVPMILLIAAILSVSIADDDGSRDWMSFGLLIFLINVMVWADFISEHKADNAVKAVEKLNSPECRVKRNGEYQTIAVRELVPGDLVSLKAGVVIPADGRLMGDAEPVSIDESSLTGESLWITAYSGDNVLSGATVQKGEMNMMVTKTGADSFFGKTIALLGESQTVGHLRLILNKAAKVITAISAIFAIFLFCWIVLHSDATVKKHWLMAMKMAFTIVASVAPAAMPVVTTTVLAVGAVQIAKENAVVSRLSAIEEAAGIEVLCSDKTGTLTKNHLSLDRKEIEAQEGVPHEYLLLMASLASSIDNPEPIDKAINEVADLKMRAEYEILKYVPFNPVDKKAVATVRSKSGEELVVCKGAPHVVRDMVCGDSVELLQASDAIINSKAERGLRTLGVCIQEKHSIDWKLLGYIALFDPPRDDTKETIRRANEMGIDVKMITGDQHAIAIETSRQLGMGTNIAGPEVWSVPRDGPFLGQQSFGHFVAHVSGFSGVYPEHKHAVVDALLKSGTLVGMTGDGVNDAPALKLATVGIAVADSTDAAKAAADIVLLQPGLSTIISAFTLSRKIFRRIEAYIVFRIYTSMLILIFYWSAIVFMKFEFPSWTLVLISMINDFTLMSTAKDNVPSCSHPLKWNMFRITLSSIWMSLLSVVSSVIFLRLNDPIQSPGFWPAWGLNPFPHTAELHWHSSANASMWLLLTVLLQLSFYSARTKYFFFLFDGVAAMPPSWPVVALQVFSITLTTVLAIVWPDGVKLGSGKTMAGISARHAGVTILWALVSFLVSDVLKVVANRMYSLSWSDFKVQNLVSFKTTAKNNPLERKKRVSELKRAELHYPATDPHGIKRQVAQNREIMARARRGSELDGARCRNCHTEVEALNKKIKALEQVVQALAKQSGVEFDRAELSPIPTPTCTPSS